MNCENILISVIIPVYNVEEYIIRCLDSVVSQTYKNIEVLLVDDGSTDRSGEICDKYAKEYNFINVYHQKNGGQSVARNYAIDRAANFNVRPSLRSGRQRTGCGCPPGLG